MCCVLILLMHLTVHIWYVPLLSRIHYFHKNPHRMFVKDFFCRVRMGLRLKKSPNILEPPLLVHTLSKIVKNDKIFKMCIILRMIFWNKSFLLKLLRNHASNANMRSYSGIFQSNMTDQIRRIEIAKFN